MRYVLMAVAVLALLVGVGEARDVGAPSRTEVPAIEMLEAEPNERADGLGAAGKREEEGAAKRSGSDRDDAEPALLSVSGGATPAPATPAEESDDGQRDEDDGETGED
jgi:hypothetical protein